MIRIISLQNTGNFTFIGLRVRYNHLQYNVIMYLKAMQVPCTTFSCAQLLTAVAAREEQSSKIQDTFQKRG